jgi:hypothetical protein
MSAAFESTTEGIRLFLSRQEADILRALPALLAEAESDPEDPAFGRLNPMAYPADPAADREFRRLVEGEVEQERRADRSAFGLTVDAAPEGTVLSLEEAEAWLRVLDEVRLVLAVRLGIDAEEGSRRVADRSDRRVLHSLYDYLTWLQGDLVDVLARRLPAG